MRAVNLIPAEQRSGASVGAGRSEGGAYAVLGLVAGIAVLVFLYGSARHEVSSRQKQAASLNAQAARAHAEAEQLAPYTSFVALQQQRQQAVDTLVGSRFDWAHVFHEFGRVLSASTSISSLSGTIGSSTTSVSASPSSSSTSSSGSAAPASPVASSTPPGSVPAFTVVGCAISQPAVAQMLQRLRLIDGVSDVQLQSSARGGGSGGGGGGSCPEGDPAFTVQISFDALPAPSAGASASSGSATSTASASSTSASSPAAASTSSGTTAQVSVR